MKMYLSQMQEKEIISIKTGLNYGHIVDVEIDSSGNITAFIAETRGFLRKNSQNSEYKFKYNEIEKIGKDVILVRI